MKKHTVTGLLVGTMREYKEANAGSLLLSLPHRNIGLAGRATYSYDSRYFGELNFGYMVPRGLPKEQMGILPFNRRRLYYFKRTFLSGKLEGTSTLRLSCISALPSDVYGLIFRLSALES